MSRQSFNLEYINHVSTNKELYLYLFITRYLAFKTAKCITFYVSLFTHILIEIWGNTYKTNSQLQKNIRAITHSDYLANTN